MRLFGIDLDSLYPNPLGSHGKTIQSRVNCDSPDLETFPNFSNARCQYCVLEPGEMLFIPAFVWHQVTLGVWWNYWCLSCFPGDGSRHRNLSEHVLRRPRRQCVHLENVPGALQTTFPLLVPEYHWTKPRSAEFPEDTLPLTRGLRTFLRQTVAWGAFRGSGNKETRENANTQLTSSLCRCPL